ncbi:MAG: ROK family protein, partial [Lachnospiraceae bacterium]|nr:ROK family protein [Lachnospiraceae bacterium]
MYYLAVDIGGTEVKIGIVTDEGRVLKKTAVSADFDDYKTPLMQTALKGAADFVRTLAEEKRLTAGSVRQAAEALGIRGIGISTTGMIDKLNGRVAGAAGHIPNYRG